MDSFLLTKIFSKIHNSIYANDGLTKEEALNEFTKLIFLKIYAEKKKCTMLSNLNINYYYEKCKNQYTQIFNSDDKINLDENTIIEILKVLNLINFLSIKSDIKGLAFQNFLKEQKSDRGQYFTPNIIIKMIISMIKKYFQPTQKFIALDTAAGSGGFLYEIKNTFKNAECIGIEINNKIARLGKMRFALEDIDYNIIVSDTLKTNFDIKADLIITNPPF
ncbi:N-6 DNA methylase, partial [Campylobacter sp.]|uniref:N-6 DNA methylase n=1 Tax=Campylobacter sp. TaxID=205 RepID=UPI0027107115|nr:N-6 DNA methylase [Campylobacter sp.]